jgi:hypothetical protein
LPRLWLRFAAGPANRFYEQVKALRLLRKSASLLTVEFVLPKKERSL